MPSQEDNNLSKTETTAQTQNNLCEEIFNDPEATRNLVGFFDLALKVHMRIHPELYPSVDNTKKHD